MRGRYYAAAAAVAIAGAWIYLRMPAADPPNRYVDSAQCIGCHTAAADGFRKSGMGRSFARVTTQNAPADVHYYHPASDTHFAMERRGDEVFQKRWQVGFDGKETNVEEKRVDYVMGSGNHSRTWLHLTSRNTLQQQPLHWYAESGGTWAMSPGYDRPDHPGSTRLAGYECMFCHNAYPQIPAGSEAPGAEWTYVTPLPEGIDCQRCHGPGKRHVDLAGTAGTAPEKLRAAIVNPKRLPPEQSMEVCMQCHLHTTARKLPATVQRADRAPFSYVAGQPLGDFRVSFEPASGPSDRFENLSAAYRLRQSRCFTESQGKLQCITCHDPHNIPRGEPAVEYYNAKCQECHPTAERAEGANCIGCHMPKRRTDDEIHVVMTDHRIARHIPEGDLLAAKRETPETAANQYHGEVSQYYPGPADLPQNALDTARAQIRDGSNLAEGLRRLDALVKQRRPASPVYYADLADGYLAAGDTGKAIPYFEEAAKRQPGSGFRLTKLGSALIDARQFPRAEEVLRRAAASTPPDALASSLLGWALWQQDKKAEAKEALERSIALDPELQQGHNYLASLLGASGDLAGAERELRAALRILPSSAEVRMTLGRLLASKGSFPEAGYHFEQAVRLTPDDAVLHYDYGRVLAAMNRAAEAEKQLREAVRLQPQLWAAHLELAMALGRRNDVAGAVGHLRTAASGSDPQVKATAEELLRKLGK